MTLKFVNLYYGKKAPLVCGARQFDTASEAERKASDENYVGTIAFTPKKRDIPFSMEQYTQLVEYDGTHSLFTKGGKPARIIADDRLSKKGYIIVALVENNASTKEAVSTYTKNGTFQIGESSDNDLVIRANS